MKEIVQAGGQARFVAADLGDAEQVRLLVEAVGEVDALVNNGGFSWFGPTAGLDPAGFDALFASNVRAAYQLVAGFAPGMVARGTGAIVNLASMAGQVGLSGGAAYEATKGGSNGSTDSCARTSAAVARSRTTTSVHCASCSSRTAPSSTATTSNSPTSSSPPVRSPRSPSSSAATARWPCAGLLPSGTAGTGSGAPRRGGGRPHGAGNGPA